MDAALVEAVIHTTGPARVDLLDVLLRRRHAPDIARIVRRFGTGDTRLDQLLIARVAELESGARLAIRSDDPEHRRATIALIDAADDPSLAYLLAEAIGHTNEATRAASGDALHAMTARLVYRCRANKGELEPETLHQQVKLLAAALGQAVQRWEQHTHRLCLTAALWMGYHVRDAVARKLQQPRNQLERPLTRCLEGTHDPQLAAFTLTALSIPVLRAVAVRTITTSRDVDFLAAVIRNVHVLEDAQIERGCRWLKRIECLEFAIDRLTDRDDPMRLGVVRLLAACGSSADDKLRLYRRLLNAGAPSIRAAALRAAADDLGAKARSLLTPLAFRADDELAAVARDMLANLRLPLTRDRQVEAAPKSDLLDRYFRGTVPLSAVTVDQVKAALELEPGGPLAALRANLSSSDPLHKARAIHLARVVAVLPELARQVYGLVHDPEPVVRTVAVAALSQLPGPTAARLARAAVDDNDERVRASAVEVMDELDLPDRASCTEPLLSARDQRLRANAVKSMLTLESPHAGETLLDMLSDPSAAHRISGLWVIDRLKLRSTAATVRTLAAGDQDARVRHQAQLVLEHLTSGSARSGPTPASPVAGGIA